MIKHVNNKIQNAIQLELFKAKESIKIVVAWFTNELLLQPLILKLQSGVSVELILNDDEINRGGESSLDFTEFLKAGGVLRWNNSKQLLHEKFCIIDNNIVISGSYNWTNKAEYNSEIETFYYGEDETTRFFSEIFEKFSTRFDKHPYVECKNSSQIGKDKENECYLQAQISSQSEGDIRDKGYFDEDGIFNDKYNEKKSGQIIFCRTIHGFYIDEFGAKFSRDKKILIKGPNVEYYEIPNGTEEIIGDAFKKADNLKKIIMPNSLQIIGANAFSGCKSLCEVVIPDSVTTIAGGAFRYCSSLYEIVISKSITGISGDIFNGCSSLQKVVIPDTVTWIGGCAFYDCSSLQEIIIPNSVVSIWDAAFSGCSSLQKVTIPDSVTDIHDSAFRGCSSLLNIIIPKSVTNIGINPFAGCKCHVKCESSNYVYENGLLLTSDKNTIISCVTKEEVVVIPSSVENVANDAFGGCSPALKIIISSYLVEKIRFKIGYPCKKMIVPLDGSYDSQNTWQDVFGVKYSQDKKLLLGCPNKNLKNYNVLEGIEIICNTAFWKCSSFRKLTLPDTVRFIGHDAFRLCSSLQKITIPNSVRYIGRGAFCGCSSLRKIVIPDSVISIDAMAFVKCTSLQEITISNSGTNISKGALALCSALQKIIIPRNTKEKYEKLLPKYKDLLVEQ